ncbi:MAG TPA: hypothetical protein VGC76_16325 [Pyrinomonadaceae bacterium]|jgi:hypothetical protein
MRNARILFGLLLFIFPVFIFAQNTDEAAKQKSRQQLDLLEQILIDSKNLRLPENKAYVYAKIGNALWQSDEKRARELFLNSVSELSAAQIEAESEKGNKQNFKDLIYGVQPRWSILFLIANRDAELAIEAMNKTRPAKLARVDVNFSEDYTSAQQYARSELQNEQQLLSIAVEQNPERAIKLVRGSFKKGLTYETVNLLNKIFVKDADAGNELAEETGQIFLETDLASNYQALDILYYFLYVVGQDKTAGEKALKISDKTLRDLASKMLDYWLKPETKSFNNASYFSIIEKLFPERAAQVKRKYEQVNNQTQSSKEQEYYKLMDSDLPPEEFIRQAQTMPRSFRNELYRRAAEKTAQAGNVAQAERILTENLSEDESEYYVSQFNYNLSVQATSQKKFDEAAAIADRIPGLGQRINALTYLATTIYQKDPKENQKAALAILDGVRALLSDAPETYEEMMLLLNLASSYGQIEPARAFALIETLVMPLNEVSQANAVVAKFRDFMNIRQGEFQVSNGQSSLGVANLDSVLQTLKNSDFERAVNFTNSFARLDTRIALQLQMIDENLPLFGRMTLLTLRK